MKNHPNGTLFVVSAPSGAGKTTLCKMLLERYPDLRYSVSFTTRSPREGETAGVDYHFISAEEFLRRIADDYWAEWALVHGNYYGTSAEYIGRSLSGGGDVLMDIDVQGAMQILKRFPDAVTIFICPPSLKILEQRLRSRGKDSSATIEKRMQNAVHEMAQKDRYRHVVVNNELAKAAEELIAIVGRYRAPAGRLN
jgi:guanylate kinase